MHQNLRWAILSLAILALAACSGVYAQEPLGSEVVAVNADEWAGLWATESGAGFFVRPRREPGTAWLGTFSEEAGQPAATVLVGHLRRAGSGSDRSWLVSVQREGEEDYYWALLIRDGDSGVLYEPDAAAFRTLILNGRLPGRLEERAWSTVVRLGDLSAEDVETILGPERRNLFLWGEPHVVRRVVPEAY